MPRALTAAVLVAVLALTACGDPIPKAEVRLSMDEHTLELSPATSDEGTVRFFVDNDGEQEHSLVFVRAEDFDELATKPDGSVDLAKVQVADQLHPVGPGLYRIQPELFPGPLVLFCNLVTTGSDGKPVSHFAAGMRAKLQIRQTTSATTRDG